MDRMRTAELRRFISFSLPLSLHVLLQNMIGLTDNVMIGRLGPEFMAALTVAGRYYFFLTILILALVSAINIIGSRLWGAGDRNGFLSLYGTAFFLVLVFTIVIATSMTVFGGDLISLMTADPAVTRHALSYFRVMALVIVASGFNILASGAFFASGDTKTPFIQQVAVTALNIFLNYCLINGRFGFPRLLVPGAAIASLISILAGNAFLLTRMIRSKIIPGIGQVVRPDTDYVLQIFRIGGPILGDMAVWQVSTILYVKFIARYGADALAIYGVAGIYMMVQSVSVMGFIQGAGIRTGHLLGAGDAASLSRFVKQSLSFTFGVAVACNLALIAIAFFLPGYFRFSGGNVWICSATLIVFTVKHLFQTVCGFFSSVIRSTKSTFPLFAMSLCAFAFVGLPSTAFAAYVIEGGIIGIALALTLEESVKAAISFFLYARLESRHFASATVKEIIE